MYHYGVQGCHNLTYCPSQVKQLLFHLPTAYRQYSLHSEHLRDYCLHLYWILIK